MGHHGVAPAAAACSAAAAASGSELADADEDHAGAATRSSDRDLERRAAARRSSSVWYSPVLPFGHEAIDAVVEQAPDSARERVLVEPAAIGRERRHGDAEDPCVAGWSRGCGTAVSVAVTRGPQRAGTGAGRIVGSDISGDKEADMPKKRGGGGADDKATKGADDPSARRGHSLLFAELTRTDLAAIAPACPGDRAGRRNGAARPAPPHRDGLLPRRVGHARGGDAGGRNRSRSS